MKLRNLLALAAVLALFLPTAAFADSTFIILPADQDGEGFFDPEPRDPVPGNPGTTLGEQRLIAFQEAGNVWADILDSDIPILVEAVFDPLPCDATSAVLGAAGPQFVFSDFPGQVAPETWHASALANARAGQDLLPPNSEPSLPSGSDIFAIFNSDIRGLADCLSGFDFYYGTDGNAPAGTLDFFNVILHELAHGLGFTSFVSRIDGSKFNGQDDTYMLNLEDHSTGLRWPSMTDSERLVSRTDTGDLHWVGQNVVAASGVLAAGVHPSGHVLMFAPNPEQPGSSVSHFDTTVTPNELMEPFLNDDLQNLVTTELLFDIGWNGNDGGAPSGCLPGDKVLCIDDRSGDRRFQVEVEFETVQGGGVMGTGDAVRLASSGVDNGGLFTFFDPAYPEILVKVLNGCEINGNYWVFYAPSTNVGFTLTVTDTETDATFVSSNPDLMIAQPVNDTMAFPCDDM